MQLIQDYLKLEIMKKTQKEEKMYFDFYRNNDENS